MHPEEQLELATRVRQACEQAAREAFEAASISGLCCTGAWECALGAIETLDLEHVLRTAGTHPPP